MKAVALCTEGDPPSFFKLVHAAQSQSMLDHVTVRAGEILVNDGKTSLLCISAATSFDARAALKGRNGEQINSAKTIKTLGFHLDKDCGLDTHTAKV